MSCYIKTVTVKLAYERLVLRLLSKGPNEWCEYLRGVCCTKFVSYPITGSIASNSAQYLRVHLRFFFTVPDGILKCQRFWHGIIFYEETRDLVGILSLFSRNQCRVEIGVSWEQTTILIWWWWYNWKKDKPVWYVFILDCSELERLSHCGELITRRGLLHCATWPVSAYSFAFCGVQLKQNVRSGITGNLPAALANTCLRREPAAGRCRKYLSNSISAYGCMEVKLSFITFQ
jgi:hypothetical protein